jgi:hypothetical protein
VQRHETTGPAFQRRHPEPCQDTHPLCTHRAHLFVFLPRADVPADLVLPSALSP